MKPKTFDVVILGGLNAGIGITASQIKDNVYGHPTFFSDIKHML